MLRYEQMLLADLRDEALSLLDGAMHGHLRALRERYAGTAAQIHLTVQTHFEGLAVGEMRLFVNVVTAEVIEEWAVGRLGGSAAKVGWDVYVRDTTQDAQATLAHMQRKAPPRLETSVPAPRASARRSAPKT